MRRPKRQGCVGGPGRASSAIALVLSLLLGAQMMAVALGSASHAWVGWFSLVPLFLVVRLWHPASALLGGALWGVVLYACSVGLPDSPILPCVRSLLLLVAVPATYACAGAWLTGRIGFSPLLLGSGWIAAEFALSPVGVGASLVAGAQAEGTLSWWLANTLGYVVAALPVILINATLVVLLSRVRLGIPRDGWLSRPGDQRTRLQPQVLRFIPITAIGPAKPRGPPGRLTALERAKSGY